MERPGHGWRLSELLEPAAEVGSIWSVARPLVYTSLRRLERDGYIETAGLERGRRGPHRVNYAPTRKGRAAARAVARLGSGGQPGSSLRARAQRPMIAPAASDCAIAIVACARMRARYDQ